MVGEIIFALVFGAVILAIAWYSLRDVQQKNDAINRAADKQIQKKAEAGERLRILRERYIQEGKRLRNRLIGDLKAIARGEKNRLDPDALEAARALQARQGEHPETIAAWWPLMKDLSGEITNPKEIYDRLDELLHRHPAPWYPNHAGLGHRSPDR
jgi:hypothetical protein